MTESVGTVPDRADTPWSPDDDELLAEQLAAGEHVPDIAVSLQRSVKAVEARARRMLPHDPHVPQVPKGSACIAWLRPRLAKGYDWRRALYGAPLPDLTRAGEPWDVPEYNRLVDELRSGLPWEDVARAHGRSQGAVQGQALLMIPDTQGSPADKILRELLAEDPNYDWRTVLKRNLGEHHPWRQSDDATLPGSSQERRQLPDVAAAAQLTVLVGWDQRRVSHVSVHANPEDAELCRQQSGESGTQSLSWHTWTGPLTGVQGADSQSADEQGS
jgi:hypothetical protein